MLDQSFSAENFLNIFQIENRKGNLKKEMFPDDYIDKILKIKQLKKSVREKLSARKKGEISKEKYVEFQKEANDEIKKYKKEKDEVLYKQMKEISRKVNDATFNFSITTDYRNGSQVYLMKNNLATFYALKQLQYNVQKTFKVKQANRYHILKQIQLLLSDDFPKYVIRTDIKSFYESISQTKLIRTIEDNTLLNYQSKEFISLIIKEYESKKDILTFEKDKGIPRGVGISAYLSELYMRDIDSKIKSLSDVTFYARYVDDIFIVITPHNSIRAKENYLKEIKAIVSDPELSLNESKTILIDMFNPKQSLNETITYLGYKFTITCPQSKYNIAINISDHKIDKYKNRIECSFRAYNTESKYNEREARKKLFDCLRMLTGNTTLTNSKKGIKLGAYFSNSILGKEDLDDLEKLDDYLVQICNNLLTPYHKLTVDKEKLKTQIINKFSFTKGFQEKRFHTFHVKELAVLKQTWIHYAKQTEV